MAIDLERDAPTRPRRHLPDRDPIARRLRLQQSRGRLQHTVADIEADVVAGLGLGQFSLVYQPRFSLHDGGIVAVEALLRWEDSSRGLLGPKAFLPLVAHTTAMVALGEWVRDEACREAVGWEHDRPAGAPPLVLSVNVAAQEILEPGFLTGLRMVVEESGLPMTLLQLEVDAADPLRGETVVATRLQQLRDQGARVAIDGALPQLGSGSLYIDADAVHLHRRWVRALATDEGVAESVVALIDRSHRSGATVCAMGVETEPQSEALAAMGCDHGQGFLYCDPVPADTLGWLDG